MKILKTHKQDNFIIFETEFESAELKSVETGILNNYARNMKVEGFRPGKAPLEIVRKNISEEELKYRVMNLLASKNIAKIENSDEYKNQDFLISGEWTFEIIKFESNKTAILNIKFELFPEVKVGDYKKLNLPEFDWNLSKEDFDQELEFLLKSAAKDVPFKDDETIAKGDLISINLTVSAEGQKEHKLQKRVFEVTENKAIIDLEKNVIGKKQKDSVEYDVTYPEDYFIKEFANKQGKIKIDILKAYHIIVPELNEEFIASLNIKTIKTKEEFLETYKKEIIQKRLDSYKRKNIETIYDELMKISEIDFYPELFINKDVNQMIYNYVNELKVRNLTLNDYLKSRNITIEQFQEDMVKEVKKSFVIQNALSFIGEKEKVVVTEENINNFFLTEAQKRMISVEDVRKKADIEKVKSLIQNALIIDKVIELNTKK